MSQGGPAYSGQFLQVSNVLGQNEENCLNNGSSVKTTSTNYTIAQDLDGLLAVQSYGKLAVCMTGSLVDAASRTYDYAAFMLIYDPRYSVFAQVSTLADGKAVYPETQLVPQQPLATATNDISTLLKGSLYVREFAACSIAAAPVGRCAAVINPSGSAATLPALAQSYAHHAVLPSNSLYGGGVVTIAAGTSSSLAPGTGEILVQ